MDTAVAYFAGQSGPAAASTQARIDGPVSSRLLGLHSR